MQRKARDNGRTPVQWDASPNAGFCPADVKPWMRVNDDYTAVNAAAQTAAPSATVDSADVSVFRFWQRALQIRKEHVELFFYGDFTAIEGTGERVFAFTRQSGTEVSVTILNFSGEEAEFEFDGSYEIEEWLMGSYDAESTGKKHDNTKIRLRPWEGLMGVGHAK